MRAVAATRGMYVLARMLLGWVLTSAVVSPFAPAHAQNLGSLTLSARPPQTACKGWNRVRSLTLHASTQLGGLTGSLTMTVDTRTGRYVVERDYGIYSEAEGFDGRVRWSRDLSGASHNLDSSAARAISATLAWLARRGWCGAPPGNASSMRLADDGMSESAWQMTPPGGTPVVLRFERSSGLPRSFAIRLPFNRLIRHFEDWRPLEGGVVVAWTQRNEDPEDESLESIRVTAVDVRHTPPSPAMFTRPPLPDDSAIVDNAAAATLHYEDDGIGRIYVPVVIDGQGPFAFEVDTGGHLILTEDTAALLHLGAVGTLSSTGAGSAVVHSGLVRTREIRVGSAVIRNQVAKVLPLGKSSNDRGSRPPRAGILGLELLERFVVGLDRTHKTVTLTPLASFHGAPHGVALPIVFNEDAPLVRGTFNAIGGEFELDSGDAGPAIVEGYWAGEHGLDERLRHGLRWGGSGIGGEYGETLTRGDFALGPLQLPHEIVSFAGAMDRGSESTRLQAGVLGESSLRRFDMIYDYGHEQVWIDPVPKAPPLPFNRAGLRVRRDPTGVLEVAFVVPDSPAAAAGLRPGDRITAVNSRPAASLAATDVALICSGPVGSQVDFRVESKEGGVPLSRSVRLAELLP
jgi:hypothetical protein